MNEHTCQKCYGRGVIPTRQPGEGETDYRKRCQAAGKSDLTKALELHKDKTLRASLAAAFGIAYCDEDCFQMADLAIKTIEAHQTPPTVAHKTMREELGISVEEWTEFMVWLKDKKPAPAARGSRETVDLNLREPSFYRNRDND